ncbi:MAG: STAS domain-containing protein, partial [Vulcanimicrobiaceae bacterium]
PYTEQAEELSMLTCAPVFVETLGKLTILHVMGELDISNYMELSEALDDAAGRSSGALIVGFVECTYIDTSGLTALVGGHRKYGKRLHVVVPHDSKVRRIFEATGLHRALLVHDDFRIAIADATVRSA